jgi:hypothetical protein
MRMLLLAAAALAVLSISAPATLDAAEGYYARRYVIGPRGAARPTKVYIRGGCRRTMTCLPRGANWMSCFDTCR